MLQPPTFTACHTHLWVTVDFTQVQGFALKAVERSMPGAIVKHLSKAIEAMPLSMHTPNTPSFTMPSPPAPITNFGPKVISV